MVQDAGVRVRTKAPCLFRDTRPRAADEYPMHPRFPLVLVSLEIQPPHRWDSPPATDRTHRGVVVCAAPLPCQGSPWHATCSYYYQVEKNKDIWGRQRAVSTVRYYVPPPCLLSCSGMTVRRSSNAYTGSAAVGEPTPPNRRHADPSNIVSEKVRRKN